VILIVSAQMANYRPISHGELRERLARLVKRPVLGLTWLTIMDLRLPHPSELWVLGSW